MDAAHASPRGRWLPSAPSTMQLWLRLHRLVVVGLLAIGLSGLIAWGLGSLLGAGFVAGDTPGVTYTASRCADLAEYAPGAATCRDAAAVHHYGEVVQNRVAAGVLGLMAAGAYLWLRRKAHERPDAFFDVFENGVGAAMFGLAAFGLLALGVGQLALGTEVGAGAYLSAAAVALPAAIVYSVRLLTTLRQRDAAAP